MFRRLIFIAALAIAGAASAATLDQTFDRTYDLRPGTRVQLDNTNGAVTIRAWDQPRIRVHAVKRAEARDDDAAKKALNAIGIEITPANGVLRIHTAMPKDTEGLFEWIAGTSVNSSVAYTLDVPRTVDLNVETVNGHIEATGVHGATRLVTTNGRIDALRCGGALDASTTNGRITAELLDVAPGHRVRLQTTNGRISLAVPKNFAARVEADTSHGSIDTNLPLMMTTHERNALRGTLNGGGNAEVRLRTTNGSIDIHGL